MQAGQHFEIVVNGFTFRATIRHDRRMGAPWKERDGHGVVSGWTTRDKGPGERVLAHDAGRRRFYGMDATMAIARRDDWQLSEDERATFLKRLAQPVLVRRVRQGRRDTGDTEPAAGVPRRWLPAERTEVPGRDPSIPLTHREMRAEAVRLDFEYLRRWCDGAWYWVGLLVELLDAQGKPVDGVSDCLWEMESDQDDRLRATALEMAERLAQNLQRKAA